MRNKTAKIFAAVIAILLVGIMVFGTLASTFLYVGAASSVGTLKKQLSTIEQQKAAVKKEIAALDSQINVVSEKKAALDRQMELTEDEIDTTEQLIDQLTEQITDKQEELAVAVKDLGDKTELFETRVRVMYENGEVTYLDVLLTSSSFSDMLSRMEIVSQIMDYDKKVVADYKAAKEDIEVKKVSLETDKTEEETYKSTLEDKYDTLDVQKSEQQKLIASLNENLDLKKAESAKMEAEKDSINSEIARLSAIAAEEKRKAEEAARQNGSSGSTGSATTPVSGTFTWPLPGYGSGSITSDYGYRIHPISGKRKLHAGMDLGAPKGAKIVAAKSGTVVKSYMSSSYGNYVVISHGGGVMTAYAHMSKRSVSEGDTVSAGQTVGLVGSTGNSTGNHLHFEVYVNGSTVNPMNYFN